MNPNQSSSFSANSLSADVQWQMWVAGRNDGFDGGDTAGVREPRNPSPTPLVGAVAIERGQ